MLKSFLIVALRNIVRQRGYSLINILGLAIGMACSILIFLFVADELSYDRYHEKSDQIYRMGMEASMAGNELKAYVTGAPAGRTMVEQVPEVLASTRVVRFSIDASETVVDFGEKQFIEYNVYYVDSTFNEIFDVEFVSGNPDECLNLPFQILITESTAKKYFGDENPMGKSLNMDQEEFIVSGVIKDCPHNSHFHYNILTSIVSSEIANYTTWMSSDFSYTYLLLEENVNTEEVREKIHNVGAEFVVRELEEGFGMSIDDFYKAGNYFKYVIQSIHDIHLLSHTNFELEANSSITYVYIFSIIAIFILIIACVNFMNLSTARSAKRGKEVGIRKVIGAHKSSLFGQFLFESIILSVIALFISMIMIESILPFFNNFSGKEMAVGYTKNIFVIPLLLLLAVFVGIFSGFYSAGYLSSIKILNIIKGSVLSGKNHSWFRNVLVIFQFTISIGLFISTFVIYSQLDFLRNKDIGFNKKDIVVINRAYSLGDSFEAFKEELTKNPMIESVSFSSTLPAKMFGGFPCTREGEGSDKQYVPRMFRVGYDFADTYELKMAEGRFFSRDYASDSLAVIINEAAVKEFGMEYPVVGKRIVTNFYGNTTYWDIVGVVKNFNFRSLHQKVDPLLILNPEIGMVDLVSVKCKTGINKESLAIIEEVWSNFVPEIPFDYYIMEEDFDNQHREEFKTGELFSAFSVLAIFIACLGLFGLASFIAEQKTKEIGIRKAMGSSVIKVVLLLSKQFTSWVVLANIIAWPVAYFFMDRWLQNFAFQIDIKLWFFLAAGFMSFLIALLTVIYQSVKAANANPVQSLRYE